MRYPLVAIAALITLPAHAKEHDSWAAYAKANRYACPGPFDTLKTARTLTLGGKTYTHSGYELAATQHDGDHAVKIGVVSAIKDVAPGTKANFRAAMAWFEQEGVEWIVANGDLALEELDLEEVLTLLGDTGKPVLIVLGNSESKGSFARLMKRFDAKYPNLVNGNWVRRVVADDVELWTMPGYYDKAFAHQGASCKYKDQDVADVGTMLGSAMGKPVVLVSHGPPEGKGKLALDWMAEQKNVGDPALTRLIASAKIPFGIFGHILEAGGNGVGSDQQTPVKPGTKAKSLYVNAGSLSADPWTMNQGPASTGMALVVTIDGLTAAYQVKRFAPAAAE